MEAWKEMAFGKIKKAKNMSVNGKITKLMAKVFTSLKKANIKVNNDI